MGYLDDLVNKSKKKSGEPTEEPKPVEAKPLAPKTPETKPIEPKPTEKPFETKPLETKPPETKPIEKALEPKPVTKSEPKGVAYTPSAPVVPKEVKEEMDVDLPFGKELIEEYGVCKIYKIDGKELLYAVPVPNPKGAERRLLDTIREVATRLITVSPEEIEDSSERKEFFKKRVLEIIEASPELGVPAAKIDFYAETVVREMIGYGPLDLLLVDDKLEEIMVIGANKPVYVFHRDHEMMKTNVVFGQDDKIRGIIDRIARNVGRRIDVKDPLLDARLPDGSRVNATIPPISLEGSTITIRKFREDPFTVVDLIKFGTLDSTLAAFLWLCVEGMRAKPANILVSGGTGSGKTTTLNTLAAFIPKGERILTMEDTAELKIPVDHWIRFETRPPGIEGSGEVSMDTLVKNSLRMRPDRIILGEIRGPEASTLFTAMNTGHDGSLGTVHANSAVETMVRLKSPPMNVPEIMLAALNLIIIQKRIHDRRKGTIRRITEVAEVTGVLEGQPQMVYLFEWDAATDTIKSTGVPSKFLQELGRYTGASHSQIEGEIEKRKAFLDELIKNKVNGIENVCGQIHGFVG